MAVVTEHKRTYEELQRALRYANLEVGQAASLMNDGLRTSVHPHVDCPGKDFPAMSEVHRAVLSLSGI